MPIIKSASKRMRQANKKRDHNRELKKELRTVIKDFTAKPTTANLSAAHSQIDKAVKKGLLKINTASRKKASLAKVAKAAGLKLTAGTKKAAPKPAAKTGVKKTETKKTEVKKPAAKKAPAKKPAAKKTSK